MLNNRLVLNYLCRTFGSDKPLILFCKINKSAHFLVQNSSFTGNRFSGNSKLEFQLMRDSHGKLRSGPAQTSVTLHRSHLNPKIVFLVILPKTKIMYKSLNTNIYNTTLLNLHL